MNKYSILEPLRFSSEDLAAARKEVGELIMSLCRCKEEGGEESCPTHKFIDEHFSQKEIRDLVGVYVTQLFKDSPALGIGIVRDPEALGTMVLDTVASIMLGIAIGRKRAMADSRNAENTKVDPYDHSDEKETGRGQREPYFTRGHGH